MVVGYDGVNRQVDLRRTFQPPQTHTHPHSHPLAQALTCLSQQARADRQREAGRWRRRAIEENRKAGGGGGGGDPSSQTGHLINSH